MQMSKFIKQTFQHNESERLSLFMCEVESAHVSKENTCGNAMSMKCGGAMLVHPDVWVVRSDIFPEEAMISWL